MHSVCDNDCRTTDVVEKMLGPYVGFVEVRGLCSCLLTLTH